MKLSPHSLFRKVSSASSKRWLYYGLLNAYLPHLGAGIRFTYISADLMTFRVQMKLRWWNRNFVGTQFGGSLYAMCDATFMLILLEAMGKDYIVWDKAATIRFRRPGRGTVRAEFRVTPEMVEELHRSLGSKEKHDATFRVQVVDEFDEVIAEVEKVIHFRHKEAKPIDQSLDRVNA